MRATVEAETRADVTTSGHGMVKGAGGRWEPQLRVEAVQGTLEEDLRRVGYKTFLREDGYGGWMTGTGAGTAERGSESGPAKRLLERTVIPLESAMGCGGDGPETYGSMHVWSAAADETTPASGEASSGQGCWG